MMRAVHPERSRMLIVAACALASFAYFCQGGGPNQNSRFDLVRAVVEHHSFIIDPYAKNTIDKARKGDHFYSDKAPGLSFASVPVYAAYHALRGHAEPTTADNRLALYLLTIALVALPSAAGAAALFALARRTGVGPWPSAVAVIAWCFGTNAFAYATLFVAHQFVAALVTIAWALLYGARSPTPSPIPRPLRIAAAGFVGAWAAISEYPLAIVGVLLFVYGVVRLGARAMVPFVLASAPPLVLLGLYNWSCFGSPFALGYEHLADPGFRAVIARGFFGIATPSARVAWELATGEFRGLLPLSPFLLLVALGYVRLLRERELRAEGILCLASATCLALLNASYTRWDGGMAMGPRYFVPALAFVIFPTAHAFAAIGALRHRALRAASLALAACAVAFSIAVCTMSVAVMPEFIDSPLPSPIPDHRAPDPMRPITTFVVPLFFEGHLGEKATVGSGAMGFSSLIPGHDRDAYNLGEVLGLHGVATLLPLFAAWLLAAIAFARVRDRAPATCTLPDVASPP
jgi:hypothetical protein